MVVATDLPSRIAHIEAPLPRCATITRPAAASGAIVAQTARHIFVGEAVKAVAPHALVVERARQPVGVVLERHGRDGRRCRSKRLAAHRETRRARRGCRRGCAAGAAAPAASSAASSARTRVVDQRRPCRSRGRRARRDGRPRRRGAGDVLPEILQDRREGGLLVTGLGRGEIAIRASASPRCPRLGTSVRPPIPSTLPTTRIAMRAAPASTSENFIEEDPAFKVRIWGDM